MNLIKDNVAKQNQAVVMMIAAQCIMGTVGVLVKQINYSPLMIAMIRGFVGTAALVIMVKLMGRPFKLMSLKSKEKIILLVSGVALAANWVFSFSAYQYADVSLVSVMLYFYPVFIILASPFIFKERLTMKNMLCVAVCVVGMLLSSGVIGGEIQATNIHGIVLSLLAAVFAAVVIVSVKLLGSIDSMNITAVQLMILSIVLLIYTGMTGEIAASSFDSSSLWLLIIAGVVHTGIAYSLQFSAIGKLPSQTSAMLSYLDPVVAIAIAMVNNRDGTKRIQCGRSEVILLVYRVPQSGGASS